MTRNLLRHRHRRLPRAGFALFELVVVILIMAIVGAIAAPRVANTIRHQRLDFASRRVMADLRLARSQAIRDQANRRVAFSMTAQTYTLPEYTGPGAPYTVRLDADSFTGVRLDSVGYSSPPEVVFSRLGFPQAGGNIVLGDDVEQVVITISATTGQPSRVFQSSPAAALESVTPP